MPASAARAATQVVGNDVASADDSAADRVVVAVRLRPWISPSDGAIVPADRARCVVKINESTTEVVDLRTNVLRGRFTYDECFDSFSPGRPGFADQQDIFDALAPPLLRSAVDGYNVTVFAYGQTASGKSYTMLGTPEAPGFIPRFVDALYAAVHTAPTENTSARSVECAFEASYLEIYMEQIRDLLNPGRMPPPRPTGGGGAFSTISQRAIAPPLRVREHPVTGPYVEDLAKIACTSSSQV